MVKGYIFDLDGVITETANLHFQAWRDEVKKIGINYTKAENSKLKGLPRLKTLEEILKLHNLNNQISWADKNIMATNKNNNYVKLLETNINVSNILPGIKKLLDQIKNSGAKMAIASSSYNAKLILQKVGLIDYFDFIVNPGNIKNGKPAPDIYLKAAELLNLQPTECVGFEDAIAGVIGLKAAKIITIAITWGEKNAWEIADFIYSSTIEIDFAKISNVK